MDGDLPTPHQPIFELIEELETSGADPADIVDALLASMLASAQLV
ncbi:hypothetical protein [Bradyrhizobium sp. JYMT SZCCT0180]|nr:hypothetical protein [Bradyrhizobium sp. JYMT SZCCT0180]